MAKEPTLFGDQPGAGTGTPSTAATLIRPEASLDELRDVAAGCEACDLFRNATQTVFGEGPSQADVVMVGEQPGDQEDIQGHPFVGPAGRILDEGLELAGIERDRVFITNVVKHFKFRPRGKRRIHQKPNAEEIFACRPWLEAELDRIAPSVVVALGATAAQALLGRSFRVTRQRGDLFEWENGPPWAEQGPEMTVTATVHPSSILRAPDDDARRVAMADFVDDLKAVARLL